MDDSKLNSILESFSSIENKLNSISPEDFKKFATLSKEYSDLKPLVEKINYYFKCDKEVHEVEELLNSEDEEIKNEANNEKNLLLKKKQSLVFSSKT